MGRISAVLLLLTLGTFSNVSSGHTDRETYVPLIKLLALTISPEKLKDATVLIQDVDRSQYTTIYRHVDSKNKGAPVFLRNGIDAGEEVVVLRQGEDRLESRLDQKSVVVLRRTPLNPNAYYVLSGRVQFSQSEGSRMGNWFVRGANSFGIGVVWDKWHSPGPQPPTPTAVTPVEALPNVQDNEILPNNNNNMKNVENIKITDVKAEKDLEKPKNRNIYFPRSAASGLIDFFSILNAMRAAKNMKESVVVIPEISKTRTKRQVAADATANMDPEKKALLIGKLKELIAALPAAVAQAKATVEQAVKEKAAGDPNAAMTEASALKQVQQLKIAEAIILAIRAQGAAAAASAHGSSSVVAPAASRGKKPVPAKPKKHGLLGLGK